MSPVPPILDYASRRRRRAGVEEWKAVVADCGVVAGATALAAVGGLATAYGLHEVFVFCFGH